MKKFYRAAVGLGLLAGFFVLAILAVAALIGLEFGLAHTHLYYAMFLVGIAIATIIFATIRAFIVAVRSGVDVPEGFELTEEAEPELWQLVRSLAGVVQTAAPDRIILVPQVQAAVTQSTRSGGARRRVRTMIIGVPLLLSFTRGQVTAVLTHELGHYRGGHLSTLPMRGYRVIERMLNDLGPRTFKGRVFRLYALLYLRATRGIGRHQEQEADAIAARVAGREALAEALRKIPIATIAWDALIGDYLVPAAAIGLRPRLVAEGYLNLLEDPVRREALDKLTEMPMEMWEGPRSPYDTHPPLSERIATIHALPHREAEHAVHEEDLLPGYALLADPDTTLLAYFDWIAPEDLAEAPWTHIGSAIDQNRAEYAARTLVRQINSERDSAHPERRSVGQIVTFDDVIRELRAGRGKQLSPEPDDGSDETRRKIAIELLSGLVGAELTKAGQAAYQLDWSGKGTLLDRRGHVLDVRYLAELVVDGWNIPDLIAFLEQEGISTSEPLDYPEPERRANAPTTDRAIAAIGPIRRRGIRVFGLVLCTHGLLVVPAQGFAEVLVARTGPVTRDYGRLNRLLLQFSLDVLEKRAGARLIPWRGIEQIRMKRSFWSGNILELVVRGESSVSFEIDQQSVRASSDGFDVLRHFVGDRLVRPSTRLERKLGIAQTDSKVSVGGP